MVRACAGVVPDRPGGGGGDDVCAVGEVVPAGEAREDLWECFFVEFHGGRDSHRGLM